MKIRAKKHQSGIHPKEWKSFNEGRGTAKQLARITRRDARKEVSTKSC